MATDELARQAVDAIEGISGHHPGFRAAHAKGTLCAATFTPTTEAARLTRAVHFQDGPVRAHVRFSNGSGNPNDPDFEPREARGMATKFYLDDTGGSRYVRYRWEPEAGEASLSAEDAEARGPDYLQDDLATRLEDAPAAFALSVQIAEDGDAVDDPSIPWPEERPRVTMGRLEITGLAHDREQGDDVLVFDPTRVTDGIELSDDPILLFRTRAYAESVLRRTGVARA